MTAIMKKTMKLFGAIMSAIILAACSQTELKDAPAPSDGGNGTNKLVAGIAEVQGKTAISGEEAGVYKIRWNADDAISVNGVTISNPELSADNLTATFDGTGLEAPYRALYPAALVDAGSFERYTVNGTDTTGYKSTNGNWYDFLTVTFPETQHYTAGTFDPTVAMLAASAENNVLTMTHICSYIKLTVTGSAANIRRVTLTHGDFKSGITGKFAVVFKENGLVSTTVVTGQAKDNLVMDCGEEGVASGTPIYIAVPERNFTGGLVITAEDVNGKLSSIKSDPFSFYDHPGIVLPVNLPFSATPAEKGQIRSANDWELFAADMNANRNLDRWIVGGKVEIVADITATALSRVSNWTYILDGKNHTITQTAGTGPLFLDIDGGTVKDLTLEGDITDESVYIKSNPGFCTIARTLKGNGTISGITNKMNLTGSTPAENYAFGAICRQVLYGTISGCTNKGNISLSVANATKTPNAYGAGIVAIVGNLTTSTNYLDGPVLISDCHNEGNVSLVITSWSSGAPFHYNSAAGIVAWVCAGDATNYLTIENCSNSGTITNTRPTNTAPSYSNGNAGGIIGVAYLPGAASYFKSKNNSWPTARSIACAYGDARNPKSSSDATLENYVDGVYFKMTDCTNSGTINLAVPSNSTTGSQVLRMKQFAGGLIGVAFGMKDKHAEIIGTGAGTCANTGTVDGGSDYTRSSYQSVNGGLIGLGGHVDIIGAYVGSADTPCEIGKSYLSFANGGIFGIMISQSVVQNCYANLKIISACAGTAMKYYGVLAGEIKGGSPANQGGLTKDSADATVYYASSIFRNCKAKGTIAHGTALTSLTTETLDSSNIADFLFCTYDSADSVIGAFDITGTGYWE